MRTEDDLERIAAKKKEKKARQKERTKEKKEVERKEKEEQVYFLFALFLCKWLMKATQYISLFSVLERRWFDICVLPRDLISVIISRATTCFLGSSWRIQSFIRSREACAGHWEAASCYAHVECAALFPGRFLRFCTAYVCFINLVDCFLNLTVLFF